MSEHVAGMIADCESKIHQLTDIVEKLRWFQREFPHTAAAIMPADKPRRKYTLKIKAAKKNDRQTDRAKRGPTRQPAHRSLPDKVEAELSEIQEALSKKTPLTPGELRAKTKLTPFTLRKRLDVLVARGAVTRTGTGPRNTFVHFGKEKASTSAPKPNGSMKRTVPALSLDEVEGLDDTVLANLRAAGRTGRSLRELQISNPEDTESALMRSLTRLKVKQKAHVDEDGRWTA